MNKSMKPIALCVILLSISNFSYADKLEWNFLQVQSGNKEWEIFRKDDISGSLSEKEFSVESFCAVHFKKSNHISCFQVKGTITPSSSIYGDDVVAIFTPQETDALPTTCNGKYLRNIPGYRKKLNVFGEMNFLCNGSEDFRSFIILSRK